MIFLLFPELRLRISYSKILNTLLFLFLFVLPYHIFVSKPFCMKNVYLFLLMLVSLQTVATPPTVPASNLIFPAIDGGFFNVAWTAGNGARRVIVCKAGSPVSFLPQNGVDYTENTNFGSGQQVAPGEFIIYDNAFTSFFLTNLSPATQYFFAVFEYNGSGAATEYLTSSFATGSATTSATPTTQVSNANFTTITTNSVIVTWTNGNGARRLIVVREGSPVNTDPVNSQPYNVNSVFGNGASIGTGNYTVYNGSSTATTVTNLKPGTQYFFSFYEFNGSNQPQYKTPAHTSSVTTRSIPTIASSNVIVTKTDGKELSLSWTNGNGQRRIIVAKQGSTIASNPVNGIDYAANPVFGSGPTIGPGEFVVYDDNFNAAVISGLNPSTTYFFKIFEYDGTGTNTIYLTSSFGSVNASTANTPTIQTFSINASNITPTSLNLLWSSGNGRARLVIARKNLPVSVVPQDFVVYSDNQDLGNNNFVVTSTVNSFITVNNLTANTNYHFAIYEYNGFNQPLYFSVAGVFSVTTTGTVPVRLSKWEAVPADNKVKLDWASSAEINTSHFIIERSADGVHFTPIETIQAAGNSQGTIRYYKEDKNPLTGRSYYRLKMVDLDGKSDYSTVRTVLITAKQSVIIARNPVQNVLEFITTGTMYTEWKIINASGQVLKQGKENSYRSEINISELVKGQYWVIVNTGKERTTIGFVKQ